VRIPFSNRPNSTVDDARNTVARVNRGLQPTYVKINTPALPLAVTLINLENTSRILGSAFNTSGVIALCVASLAQRADNYFRLRAKLEVVSTELDGAVPADPASLVQKVANVSATLYKRSAAKAARVIVAGVTRGIGPHVMSRYPVSIQETLALAGGYSIAAALDYRHASQLYNSADVLARNFGVAFPPGH